MWLEIQFSHTFIVHKLLNVQLSKNSNKQSNDIGLVCRYSIYMYIICEKGLLTLLIHSQSTGLFWINHKEDVSNLLILCSDLPGKVEKK